MIAIHSTLLGPAIGGLRIARYAQSGEALADALRLSRAITFTAAAADCGSGGGASVVPLPMDLDLSPGLKEAILLDVADDVHGLDGRFYACPDIGTSARDIDTIRRRTPYVCGYSDETGGAGGTAYGTFLGVDTAIRVGLRHGPRQGPLDGVTICILGLGGIGALLAQAYADEGARLVVADVDRSRRMFAEEIGAQWVSPASALFSECDLLVPCGDGGILTAHAVPRLRARVICGAANNQLANDLVADTLLRHGILYIPDFIANAGGLIFATAIERRHQDETSAEAATQHKIEQNVELILSESTSLAITPLEAALRLARDRLDAAKRDLR